MLALGASRRREGRERAWARTGKMEASLTWGGNGHPGPGRCKPQVVTPGHSPQQIWLRKTRCTWLLGVILVVTCTVNSPCPPIKVMIKPTTPLAF